MACIAEKKLFKLGQDEVLKHFIPEFMTKDGNFQGLIYAIESELQRIADYYDILLMYVNLDYQDEQILDELAWQFNIEEYDKLYPIETKRELIKGCFSIHHKRGTVAAVREVAEKIFGNATIEEWFDYGGNPYHFRIRTDNVTSSDEMIQEMERIVKKTQNIRSHLDSVIIEIMKSLKLTHGCIITATTNVETLSIENIE